MHRSQSCAPQVVVLDLGWVALEDPGARPQSDAPDVAPPQAPSEPPAAAPSARPTAEREITQADLALSASWGLPWDVPVITLGFAPAAHTRAAPKPGGHAGAHLWLPHLRPGDWPAALAFARAAHQRELAQRQRIASLESQLAEQQLVARAKGLLMAAQGMTENEAFALLRSGAMQTRLPLADKARAVVDAARWAQAVNRAGQLRWLSQRCMAAAAQRLARIEAPAARRAQHAALKRAWAILDELQQLPLPEPARQALAEVNAAWQALQACLNQRLDLSSLAEADAAAEGALTRAEALTNAVQAAGHSAVLPVVNLCGRQRMRAQRLLKLGLLARLGAAASPAAALAEAPALIEGFSSTLLLLEKQPLRSNTIDLAHQQAVQRWADTLRALQGGDIAALVHSGELLLVSVDDLTHCWERSLQAMLG